ncbi:MAG TPA: intradiol ring-cleavage dioxygenase [Cyclobacteriaceae bacterium]|nr:intradiol ring-cleavage dioxygenase [Cyclobacteriaceae bacterium]
MKKSWLLLLAFTMLNVSGCAQSNRKNDRVVGSACEACELMFNGMPGNPSWQTTIADPGEPGEPLIISGTIYKKDGKTPAQNVILYVYHTDNKGLYSPAPKQTLAKRHGHLRGWMKTDEQGRYEFKTIRPASYPNSNNPQHIHPLIKEPGVVLYWIDEFLFEDDPLLTEREKSNQEKRGGSGIITLTKNEKGIWIGKRDIILGMNIPNY